MATSSAILLLFLSLTCHASLRVLGQNNLDVGVCYGLNGNNLPPPKDVVNLYQRSGFSKMRIYEPNHDVLEALRGSKIDLTLGVRNQDIPTLASGEEAANSWFVANVKPYANDINIQYISVGNEVIPGEFGESILPAMQNLQNVIKNNNLGTKATTVVHSAVLGNSYPPSAGTFSDAARPTISKIIQYLSSQKSPLLANIYPYFAYASDPAHIRLDYAQFTTPYMVVQDGDLGYSNLLEAMMDAFFSAMEKEGVSDVDLVISETGWPHDGNGNLTTPELAATYNKHFIQRFDKFVEGTPKRPFTSMEGFIFAIFDENEKDFGVEQHWGLFSPTMQPNYNILD